MLTAVREEEATLTNRHLVAHNFPQQMSAMSSDFNILNEHYPANPKEENGKIARTRQVS